MIIDVEIDLSPAGVIADRVLPDSGLSTFVPETCARYFDPYVPMDSGDLVSTYTAHDYTLEYSMPYARRQYNGDGFNFSRDKHALATAHWDAAAMSAKGAQIAREIQVLTDG